MGPSYTELYREYLEITESGEEALKGEFSTKYLEVASAVVREAGIEASSATGG